MYNKFYLNDGRIFHRRVDITKDRSTSRITMQQMWGCALHRHPAMESGSNSACTVLQECALQDRCSMLPLTSHKGTQREGVGCSQWHSAHQPSTSWCQNHQGGMGGRRARGGGAAMHTPADYAVVWGRRVRWVLANFLQAFSSFLGLFLYQLFYSPLFFSLLYILLSDLNSPFLFIPILLLQKPHTNYHTCTRNGKIIALCLSTWILHYF